MLLDPSPSPGNMLIPASGSRLSKEKDSNTHSFSWLGLWPVPYLEVLHTNAACHGALLARCWRGFGRGCIVRCFCIRLWHNANEKLYKLSQRAHCTVSPTCHRSSLAEMFLSPHPTPQKLVTHIYMQYYFCTNRVKQCTAQSHQYSTVVHFINVSLLPPPIKNTHHN